MSGSGSVVEAEADSVPALEDISSEDESVPSLVYSDLSEIECEVVPRPLPVAHESSTADDDEDDPDFDADDDDASYETYDGEADYGEVAEEEDEDDEDGAICWCPTCTQRRASGASASEPPSDPTFFPFPPSSDLREYLARLDARHPLDPDWQPPDPAPGHGPHEHAHSFQPILTHPALMAGPHAIMPWELDPSAEIPGDTGLADMPSQRKRVASSMKQDALGGERPPTALLPLLNSRGYLQGVLSRLPGVNPQDASLKAIIAALQRTGENGKKPTKRRS